MHSKNTSTVRLVRTLTPWAVCALLLVIAGGVYFAIVSGQPLPHDSWWRDTVEAGRGSLPWAVAVFFAEVGTFPGVAAMAAIAIALLLVRGRRRDAGSLATALLAGVAISELLKSLVLRPRPTGQLFVATGSSYPSGHSMAAAALAISLALIAAAALPQALARWAWVAAFLWIGLMVWSRAALRVHWLTDTLAGVLLGAAVAILARRLWVTSASEARETANR